MAGIMVVFGTRPEAIKMLPVVNALLDRGVPVRVCVTAQHRDLLDRVLGFERIHPDVDLDLMRPGQSLTELTGTMITALGRVFASEQPERVIVQGDTATAVAAAQAALLSGIPVAHVEAGLRTGDLTSPFPEEGNRRMISAIADLHFAPTGPAAQTLLREGADLGAIHVTGNTVVDALRAVQQQLAAAGPPPEIGHLLDRSRDRHLILVTCHRRENLAALGSIIRAVEAIAAREDVFIAMPLHPNPALRRPITDALGEAANVALLEPLDFLPFIALLSAAHLALTDSGGVQEEAPVLGVPLLVLRDKTERPEGLAAGTALLVGTGTDRIVAEAVRLLDNPLAHARMARKHSPYGDGHAAARIADLIADAHGYAAAPGKALGRKLINGIPKAVES